MSIIAFPIRSARGEAEVLARLPLAGTELVLDVGCGTGRLTFELLQRLPRGRAIGVDLSETCSQRRDATCFPPLPPTSTSCAPTRRRCHSPDVADAIFSTATFHWVRDHDRSVRESVRRVEAGRAARRPMRRRRQPAPAARSLRPVDAGAALRALLSRLGGTLGVRRRRDDRGAAGAGRLRGRPNQRRSRRRSCSRHATRSSSS